MKINFGEYKGRKILIGNNKKMRPTTAYAKKIIFSWLKITDTDEVLDLFSGTGSLAFESLSLGAKSSTIVDNNLDSILGIKKTISSMKDINSEKIKIRLMDFRNFLKTNKNMKYTIIFIDPPFIDNSYWNDALFLIKKYDSLKKSGVIILEIPFKYDLDIEEKFEIVKKKKMGSNNLLQLKHFN